MKQCETFKSIPATLGWARWGCFSIPDRSGQDPCEATGNPVERIMAARAVRARALPDQLSEPRAERPERRTAHLEANVCDAHVAPPKQRLGPLDSAGHEIGIRRLAEGSLEAAGVVARGHGRRPRERGNVEGQGVIPVDHVASSAKSHEIADLHRLRS